MTAEWVIHWEMPSAISLETKFPNVEQRNRDVRTIQKSLHIASLNMSEDHFLRYVHCGQIVLQSSKVMEKLSVQS